MWLFSELGFVSVVQYAGKSEMLLVRGRNWDDITRIAGLCGNPPIKETADSDYRFRFEVTRPVFAAALTDMIERLEYTNFKNVVHVHVIANLMKEEQKNLETLTKDD